MSQSHCGIEGQKEGRLDEKIRFAAVASKKKAIRSIFHMLIDETRTSHLKY
jgi:hypothetical protein